MENWEFVIFSKSCFNKIFYWRTWREDIADVSDIDVNEEDDDVIDEEVVRYRLFT